MFWLVIFRTRRLCRFPGGAVHGELEIRRCGHANPRARKALRNVAKTSHGGRPAATAAAASRSAACCAVSWSASIRRPMENA
jgi:hypothetical protein